MCPPSTIFWGAKNISSKDYLLVFLTYMCAKVVKKLSIIMLITKNITFLFLGQTDFFIISRSKGEVL